MITLVCGPPGAGKTTYVREHMNRGDLVVDLDYLYHALCWQNVHEHPSQITLYARTAFDAVVTRLEVEKRKGAAFDAWVIACLPDAGKRNEMARNLSAKVVMLDVPYEECMKRIMKDESRKPLDVERWHLAVSDWHKRYWLSSHR